MVQQRSQKAEIDTPMETSVLSGRKNGIVIFSEFLSDLQASQEKAAIEKHRDYFDAALRAHEANAPLIAAQPLNTAVSEQEKKWDAHRSLFRGAVE